MTNPEHQSIDVGDFVVTAHGPTGRDTGRVDGIEFTEQVMRNGEYVDPPVWATWCRVKLDDGSTMSLDWRTDGHGRIRIMAKARRGPCPACGIESTFTPMTTILAVPKLIGWTCDSCGAAGITTHDLDHPTPPSHPVDEVLSRVMRGPRPIPSSQQLVNEHEEE